MAISFIYGSQSLYDEQLKNNEIAPEGVYFINDTQRIYRGDELITQSGMRFVTELPDDDELQDETLYVVTTVDKETSSSSFEIYYYNGTEVKQVAGSDAILNKDALIEALPIFSSVDLDNIDDATDDQLITAGAVKDLLSWKYMTE